ncbi:MAG TPA: GIY-YIG nuclease family protein [Gammaproteobacteria bacterium]|nr:GIY-YIG nuclease family protein [Gammaproteobacteria bacterium]HDZ79481.1 GIY-YIG nuclease family protein [Gammaproteobacteria bacterium]
MWTVYIVQCADNSLYTGITNNVDTRIALHNMGKGAKYTRSRLPVKLVYSEQIEDKGGALRREIQIKKLSPQQKRDLVANRPFKGQTVA